MLDPRTRQALPLTFWMEDVHNHSTIYIVDEELRQEQRLSVMIENSSGNTLYFKPFDLETQPPSAAFCHFELRFRRGALADSSLGTSQNKQLLGASVELLLSGKYRSKVYRTGSWVISEPDDRPELPYVSFYLSRAGRESVGKFEADQRLKLVLTNISAAPQGGTRESRVELVPSEVYTDASLRAESQLTQPREQSLQVVNHLGKEFIPLHLAFIGPHTVLNDGELHGPGYGLKLRITNTSKHDPISFKKDSKWLFQFDYAVGDPDEELGSAENVREIEFELDGVEIEGGEQFEANPHWVLDHTDQIQEKRIEPGEHWDVNIRMHNFSTLAASGKTQLKIKYENVPGYWDGELHIDLEKTPLFIKAETHTRSAGAGGGTIETYHTRLDAGVRKIHIPNRVGIGGENYVDDEDIKLLVVGTIMGRDIQSILNTESDTYSGNNLTIRSNSTTQTLKVGGENGILIDQHSNRLRIGGEINPNSIFFTDNGSIRSHDASHEIIFDRADNKLELREYGDIIFSPGARSNRTQKVTMFSSGNVGIGVPSTSHKLEVSGSVKASSMESSGSINCAGLFSTVEGAQRAGYFESESVYPQTSTVSIRNKGNSGGALYIYSGFAAKPEGGEWAITSDQRLKRNIRNYQNGLADLKKIKPVWFQYNGKEGLPEIEQVGIIAQEIQKFAPYMVFERPGENGEPYLMTNTSAMKYMLVNAVQELSEQVDQLQKRIRELEQRFTSKKPQ